jgi:hypothetical protein
MKGAPGRWHLHAWRRDLARVAADPICPSACKVSSRRFGDKKEGRGGCPDPPQALLTKRPEVGAPVVRRGGLSATITVRFSPEDASAIRDLAQGLGVPYSEIVRRAVRKFVHIRLAVREGVHDEPEDRPDYSFSTGNTRTGMPALAGR